MVPLLHAARRLMKPPALLLPYSRSKAFALLELESPSWPSCGVSVNGNYNRWSTHLFMPRLRRASRLTAFDQFQKQETLPFGELQTWKTKRINPSKNSHCLAFRCRVHRKARKPAFQSVDNTQTSTGKCRRRLVLLYRAICVDSCRSWYWEIMKEDLMDSKPNLHYQWGTVPLIIFWVIKRYLERGRQEFANILSSAVVGGSEVIANCHSHNDSKTQWNDKPWHRAKIRLGMSST